MSNTTTPPENSLTFSAHSSIRAHLDRKMIALEDILSRDKQRTHKIYNPIEMNIEPIFDESEWLCNHIWADRIGHIREATPNAKLIVQDAAKTGIYHGQNKYGNHIFSKIKKEDGNQIWASLNNNGLIRHLGANRPKRHYIWTK